MTTLPHQYHFLKPVSSNSSSSAGIIKVQKAERTLEGCSLIKTNWGTRNSEQFLHKLESLHKKKVHPQFLGIKTPNYQVIKGCLKDDADRNSLKKEDRLKREMERLFELQAKAESK